MIGYVHHCLRCGHRWESWTECPGRCPNCLHFKWDTPPDFRGIRRINLGADKRIRGVVGDDS